MLKLTLADHATRVLFRSELVRVARLQIGNRENPAGSNRTPYGLWFGLDGHPWCAMFASWVYDQTARRVGCENPLVGVQTRKGFAGVTAGFATMKRRGWVLGPNEKPMVGDLVCWDNDPRPGGPGHTGIVVKVGKDSCGVVEGNTDGNQSRTGGIVQMHDHEIDYPPGASHGVLLGYVRPTRRYGR